jgi:hypothetical protein
MLEGTEVLPNSSSCYIHAENFKLLPRSLGKTTVNLIKTHIVLPNIESILNFPEEDLLQPDVMQPVELTAHRWDCRTSYFKKLHTWY